MTNNVATGRRCGHKWHRVLQRIQNDHRCRWPYAGSGLPERPPVKCANGRKHRHPVDAVGRRDCAALSALDTGHFAQRTPHRFRGGTAFLPVERTRIFASGTGRAGWRGRPAGQDQCRFANGSGHRPGGLDRGHGRHGRTVRGSGSAAKTFRTRTSARLPRPRARQRVWSRLPSLGEGKNAALRSLTGPRRTPHRCRTSAHRGDEALGHPHRRNASR